MIVPFNEARAEYRESYFNIWIISHSSQDRNQPKVNYEGRTKSFLTDGNCESAMEKPYRTPRSAMFLGVQWNVFHCTLGKWNFFLISRDHNQPNKRPEFNEVLYNINWWPF